MLKSVLILFSEIKQWKYMNTGAVKHKKMIQKQHKPTKEVVHMNPVQS